MRNRYLTNSAADSLRCARYVADSDRDAVRLSRQGDYPEGELFVTATTDEDGRLSYTFYDKGGQSVLSRQMNGSEALDTYYVYDACGLLRAVLPPKASAMLESQTGALDMSSATVADLTYLYRYDRRGRPVGVRRPGAQEVRYLYDDTDRPVFSQDGVQRRSGEWSYSIPDALGREVLRGTCKTLGGSNLAQSLLDGKTLVARYDGSSGDAGYAVLLDGQAVELASGRFLSAQYYDSYDFLSRSEFSELGFENDPNYGKRYTGGDKSLHTGSIRTSLSPQQTVRMPEAYYYDLHGRLVQCNGRNHLGGKDRYLARYDFTGRPVQTRESHSSSASGSQRGLTTTLAYDHDGRLSQRRTTLSSVTTPLTARYSYDEAGRLSEKTLGPTPVSYAYNVRGWIGKIASAPFVSELRYENPRYGGAPLYSGMVSQWTWKHGQQPENDYVFSYDGVGRMVAAKHFVDGARTDGYTERGIRYDANGNLLSISRTAGGAVSDSLRFTLGGDVLLDVSGTSTGVFEYDPSGNLVKDGLNRLEFSYNCLNLMQTAETASGALKAQFTYGSDGRKLSEKAKTGGFEYLGSLIYAYRGGTLSLAQAVTDEGTIQSAGVNYFIRDHLGSVRAVVDHTGKTVERNDYYPFGGRHENSALSLLATNRYKFGGKESLEPVSLDMLDFGARFYDPRIVRWNTQDPLAEKYFSLSPYNYCAGNPITLVDPTGMVMDDYRLKKNGEIELMKKTNDNYDVIYAENEKGEVDLSKSIQIDKNIISSKQIGMKIFNGEIYPYDQYEISNDQQAQNIFSFVANNSVVEWSLSSLDIFNSRDHQPINYLTTSHEYGMEYGGIDLFEKLTTSSYHLINYRINQHSHTNGSTVVSHGDVGIAKKIQDRFPNAKLYIYAPLKYNLKNPYTQFSRDSKAGKLPEFVVTP